MEPRHIALLVFTMVVWGINIIVNKVVVDAVPPVFFAALRFVVMIGCLFPWLKIVRGRMKEVVLIALTANVMHYAFFFTALRLAEDASVLAIVTQLNVPFVAILGFLLLGERLGWQRALAAAVAFSGVAIISFDPRVLSYFQAVSMTVVAVISYAYAAILIRRLAGVSVLQLQAWLALFSMPGLMAVSLLTETDQVNALANADIGVLFFILYSALGGSVFCHCVMTYLYQRYPVSEVVTYTLISPVVSVIAGVAWLGDQLSLRVIVGSLITLGGIAIFIECARRVSMRARAAE